MPDSAHLLPSLVLERWETLTGALSAQEAPSIMRLAETYLPPCTKQALMESLSQYSVDYPGTAMPSIVDLERMCDTLSVAQAYPRHYATQYPLHAAIHKLFRHSDHTGHRTARLVLVGLFRRSVGDNPDVYYAQLLTTRRCLAAVVDQVNGDHRDWHSAAEEFRLALNGHVARQRHDDHRVQEDLRAFQNLLTGHWRVGIGRKNQPRGITRQRTTRQKTDTAIQQRLTSYATPPSGAARAQALARQEARGDDGALRIGTAEYQPAPAPSRASATEPADSDAAERVRRPNPTALTPEDDRALMRRAPRMAATSAIVALTDPQRLPMGRILEALAALTDHDEQWAFAWLVLTTGLAPSRLERLRASPGIPGEDTPYWHEGILSYRVMDGPVAAGPDGDNQLVTLALPYAIRQVLWATGKDEPFVGVAKSTDDRLARAFWVASGTTPTLLRLRATAELHILEHAQDTVAGRALGGRHSVAYAAPAAYRKFAPGELQSLFEAITKALTTAIGALGEPDPALARRIDAMRFPGTGHGRTSGSARALTPAGVCEVFTSLHAAGARQGTHLLQMPGHEREWVGILEEVFNAQAAITYLAWALATGGRPVGPKTVFIVADKGVFTTHDTVAYLSDKASGAYRERRLVPVIHALSQQLTLHGEAQRITEALLQRRGWSVCDARHPDQRDLPARLRVPGRGQTAEWRAFRQADFRAALSRAGCTAGGQLADNAPRHTVATHLRQVLPEAQVDALLGHARLGLGISAPASTTTLDWRGLREALGTLLDESGFQPTTMDALYHAR